MTVIIFIAGFLVGSICATITMSLVSINNYNKNREDDINA